MLIISVDPGTSGAIAFLGEGSARVFDLPTIEMETEGTVRKRIHAPALQEIVMANIPEGEDVRFVIEGLSVGGSRGRPGETQGSSAQTVGSQYRTRGTIEGLMECLGLEVNEVYPRTWKHFYGLVGKQSAEQNEDGKNEAERARCMAITLFPDLRADLKRVRDHNRAEAVLIGNWFRKVKS